MLTSLRITSLILLVICALGVNAIACTVEVVGLRKEFRHSKNVFVGKVVSVEGVSGNKLPDDLAKNWKTLDLMTFRIEHSWKGRSSGSINIYSNVICDCPNRVVNFKTGSRFLIFADGNGFADACSMRIFNPDDPKDATDLRKSEMARLDGFWFRAWATLYPF